MSPVDPARLLMIDLSSTSLTPDERAFLSERQPGGVCLFGRNVIDRFQVADLVAQLRSLAGPGLLVAIDQEGGGVVRIEDLPYPPSAMALGAADDPELTGRVAGATGRGLASLAINVDFAPVADVNSNPANPVIADRSFGADPELVARHVAAFVSGLQNQGVAATVKHFPGHGDTAVDSHLSLPNIERSRGELDRLELAPFRAAIGADAAAVMSAHIVVPALDPELPATLSAAVIGGLLRGELGFQGVVFSDALDMKAVAARWDQPAATELAVAAGVDMATVTGGVDSHLRCVRRLEEALREGRLEGELVMTAVRRTEDLGRRFPPRSPLPAEAWQANDRELLAEASQRALVRLGDLPRLRPGERVLVVAAAGVRQSAATQATVDAAAGFLKSLSAYDLSIELVEYQAEQPELCLERAVAAAAHSRHVLFVTTNRTPLPDGVAELGWRLARTAGSFVHVALWNPYAVASLPRPALVTFGWRPTSASAAAAALARGEPVTGTAPVPLATAGTSSSDHRA